MPKNGQSYGKFIDLGHGVGKGVLSAAILHPFEKCIGIDIVPKLVKRSEILKKKYLEVFEDIKSIIGSYNPIWDKSENLKKYIHYVDENEKFDFAKEYFASKYNLPLKVAP